MSYSRITIFITHLFHNYSICMVDYNWLPTAFTWVRYFFFTIHNQSCKIVVGERMAKVSNRRIIATFLWKSLGKISMCLIYTYKLMGKISNSMKVFSIDSNKRKKQPQIWKPNKRMKKNYNGESLNDWSRRVRYCNKLERNFLKHSECINFSHVQVFPCSRTRQLKSPIIVTERWTLNFFKELNMH